jgi:hypothetical protein
MDYGGALLKVNSRVDPRETATKEQDFILFSIFLLIVAQTLMWEN